MGESIFRPWDHSSADHSDRSASDRHRHNQKVREAIQDNIADIIGKEEIIGRSGDKIIKVPIHGIKQWKFVYGNNSGVGQGKGSKGSGDEIGRAGDPQDYGKGVAGDKPGVDYYETEITLAEIIEMMFEDLELPEPERKMLRQIEVQSKRKRDGYRRAGKRNRFDVSRILIERKKRQIGAGLKDALQIVTSEEYAKLPEEMSQYYSLLPSGVYEFHYPIINDDLVYKHYNQKPRRESNAVVICIMDTSGSMDTVKKYLARSFFFLLYKFVQTKYRNVELVFIAHDTEAKEVNEKDFFTKGESGGTMMSSGMKEAKRIILSRYDPSLWNVYSFYCSDGDNFPSDEEDALVAARELCELTRLFGYGEIKPEGGDGQKIYFFKNRIPNKNFRSLLIVNKQDVYKVFKEFLSAEKEETGA